MQKLSLIDRKTLIRGIGEVDIGAMSQVYVPLISLEAQSILVTLTFKKPFLFSQSPVSHPFSTDSSSSTV